MKTSASQPPTDTRHHRGSTIARLLVYALILTAPLWVGTGGIGATPLDRGLVAVTQQYKFSLTAWMTGAIAERLGRVVRVPSASAGVGDGRDAVLEYVRLTKEIQVADAQIQSVAAEADDGRRQARLAELSATEASLLARREQFRPLAEETISAQVESVLAGDHIRERTLGAASSSRFPFFAFTLRPGVAFRLGDSPDALIVSPRDRIQVVGSVLLTPNTSFPDAEAIENATDRMGVSSIVTRTGGLAIYPTMVVPSTSLRGMLSAISHEWTHHYLAFTNLGSRYFDSYDMRTINETVADMIGAEVGGDVYTRYYALLAPAPPVPTTEARPPAASTVPTFGQLMGSIRLEVEGYLSREDVPGAERYMAEQRVDLVTRGYQVRKLNTAYLSFFGSYSGGENPYERRLRQLREQSGSLAEFLESVSTVSEPGDLDALLARRR